MITLTGEKVDIHVMRDVPAGEWTHVATEVTDKAGRITFNMRDEKTLGYGLYPIKVGGNRGYLRVCVANQVKYALDGGAR